MIAEAYDLKDIVLAEQGLTRVRWAEGQMPVLRSIRERFSHDRPLSGLRIGACLHVTTETANLMIALKAAGVDPSRIKVVIFKASIEAETTNQAKKK